MNLTNRANWLRSSILLGLIIALGLGGCARTVLSDPSDPSSAPGQAERTVITFAVYDFQRLTFKALAEQFGQEYPGIEVQLVDITQAGQTSESGVPVNQLKTMASLADTTIQWGQSLVEPNAATYFLDLKPMMAGDPGFQSEDFWTGLLSACEDPESRALGIPLTATMQGVFYHPEAFEAAGIPRPEPGWTWGQFQQAVTALADPSSIPPRYGYADRDRIFSSVLAPLADQILIDRQQGTPHAVVLQDQIQWYIEAAQKGLVRPVRGSADWTGEKWEKNWSDWQNLFSDPATQPAMWVGALDEMPMNASGPGGENPYEGSWVATEGFAPFPVSSEGTSDHTSPVFVECVTVSAGTQHPREAWTWAKFLTRQWIIQNRTQIWEVSRIPARRSVADAEGFWTLLPDPVDDVVKFALEHAWHGSRYPQQMDAVDEALAQSIVEGKDFAALLEEALAREQGGPALSEKDSAPVVSTPKPTPELGAAQIRFYYGNYDPREMATYAALADQFMREHPNISVKVEDIYFPGDDQGWLTGLADQFDCYYSNLPILHGEITNLLLDVSPFFEAEGQAFQQDFDPGLLDIYRDQGRIFGLPAQSQPQIMGYNADLLAQLGYAAPDPEWTFEDFFKLATEIGKDTRGDYYGYMSYAWDEMFWAGFDIGWGRPEANPPQAFFDASRVVQHMQWILDMDREGVFYFQTPDNWSKAGEIMKNGQAAFWTTQAGRLYGPDDQMDYNERILPLPRMSTPNPMINASTEYGFFILKKTAYPQACWEWIRFVSGQPDAFMAVPARLSVRQDPTWVERVGQGNAAVYRTAVSRVDRGDYGTFDSQGWPLFTWRSQAVEAVLAGTNPIEALGEAQRKANAFQECIQSENAGSLQGSALNELINACARQADPDFPWVE